jgi:segregation and condensation protein B
MTAVSPVTRDVEALLFLAPEPLTSKGLAEACDVEEAEVVSALEAFAARLEEEGRGILLREVAGGWALSSNPESEDAARRMFAAPRTPPLTSAQAETLAIVAYLQPVSRPEIARIRGVNAESAAATLLERGVIEESGRSPFGAVLYRTSELFLRLFGLASLDDLPDIGAWDPAPEVEEALRERLLKVGAERSGDSTTEESLPTVPPGDLEAEVAVAGDGNVEAEESVSVSDAESDEADGDEAAETAEADWNSDASEEVPDVEDDAPTGADLIGDADEQEPSEG